MIANIYSTGHRLKRLVRVQRSRSFIWSGGGKKFYDIDSQSQPRVLRRRRRPRFEHPPRSRNGAELIRKMLLKKRRKIKTGKIQNPEEKKEFEIIGKNQCF
jgi:hypothetical protein